MFGTLQTQRLLLRPLALKDAAFIFTLLNSTSWIQFIGDRGIQTMADAERYIHEKQNDPHYHCHVFENLQTQQPLGIVTFILRSDQSHPDIGYAILPQFQKQQYTYEAVNAYLTALQKEEPCREIIAITRPENTASINLLKKIHMRPKDEYWEAGVRFLRFSSKS